MNLCGDDILKLFLNNALGSYTVFHLTSDVKMIFTVILSKWKFAKQARRSREGKTVRY